MLPLIGWSLLALAAAAEPRHALLISNSNHPFSKSDSQAMRARLEQFHFTVDARENPNAEDLRSTVAALAKQTGTVLFYYSGKSADYGSDVQLLPADYSGGKPDQKSAVPLAELIYTLEAGGAATRILLIEGGFVKSGQSVYLTNLYGAPGTFLAFAASQSECGETAWKGPNSPFTTKLLAALSTHSSLEEAYLEARYQTMRDPAAKQTPWAGDSLTEDFLFDGPKQAALSDSEAAAGHKAWLEVQQSSGADVLRAFLKQHPNGLHAFQARRLLAAREGRPYQETPLTARPEKGIPKTAEKPFREAAAKEDAGDRPAAVAAYSEAIAAKPDYVLALCSRARLLAASNELPKAVQDVETALAKDPRSGFCLTVAGQVYRAMRRNDDAFRVLSSGIQSHPWWQALNERGLLLENLGELDLALADYQQAIQLSPSTVAARVNACNVHNSKGQPAQALKFCNDALALDSRDARAHNNRGMSYIMLGQFDKALADLDLAVELAPDMYSGYTNRGFVLMQLRRMQDALRDLDRAAFLAPGNVTPFLYRATLKINAGDEISAQADLDRAERLQPGIVKRSLARKSAVSQTGLADR
ncbi:MAG: tetratricopeptide repeat protein [Bryobacterales bacterium]|nr:tetratricopeptide repeat protein [Bryobacterales bacterium]